MTLPRHLLTSLASTAKLFIPTNNQNQIANTGQNTRQTLTKEQRFIKEKMRQIYDLKIGDIIIDGKPLTPGDLETKQLSKVVKNKLNNKLRKDLRTKYSNLNRQTSLEQKITLLNSTRGKIIDWIKKVSKLNNIINKSLGENFRYQTYLNFFIWLNNNTNIDMEGLKEILNGAHVVIQNDNGKLFKTIYEQTKIEADLGERAPEIIRSNWGDLKKLEHPESSHISCGEIYTQDNLYDQIRFGRDTLLGLDGVSINDKWDGLMGLTCEGHPFENNTWFQLERARIDTTFNKAIHTATFLEYKFKHDKKINLGPFGSSPYVELKPLKSNGKNIYNIWDLKVYRLCFKDKIYRESEYITSSQDPYNISVIEETTPNLFEWLVKDGLNNMVDNTGRKENTRTDMLESV